MGTNVLPVLYSTSTVCKHFLIFIRNLGNLGNLKLKLYKGNLRNWFCIRVQTSEVILPDSECDKYRYRKICVRRAGAEQALN